MPLLTPLLTTLLAVLLCLDQWKAALTGGTPYHTAQQRRFKRRVHLPAFRRCLAKREAALDARHSSQVFVAPPLPTWPREVHPFEPVHGYFQRLAHKNGLLSLPTLMESMGVSGRRPASDLLFRIVEQFPGVDIPKLRQSTAVIDGKVRLNGQVFRSVDYSCRRPRVCSGCLTEARYYRNWFDLQIIDACPIHKMSLEGQGEAPNLTWWFPQIGIYPDGREAKSRTVDFSVSWEAYVLGRMGVITAHPNVLLDRFPLSEVTAACLVVGRGLQRGRGERGRIAKPLALPPVIRSGFSIMSQGREVIATSFRSQFAAASGAAGPDSLQLASWKWLGWLREAVANSGNSPLLKIVEEIAEGAAAEFNIYSRKRLPEIGVDNRPLTLKEVSQKLGVKPQRVLDIGKHLGIARNQRASGLWHSFSPLAVAEIEAALDQLVPRREAIQLSGLTRQEFEFVSNRGFIAPVTKLGGGSLGCDHYLKSDLSALAPKLQSMRSELRRKLPRRVPPKRLGMTTTQVANALGVSFATVRDLAERGHLTIVSGSKFRGRSLYNEDSVEKFRTEYVSTASIAKNLGCRGCDAPRIMVESGVALLDLSPKTTRLVARSELSRVFGNFDKAPEAEDFFVDLDQYWIQAKSVSAIRRRSGETATVSSGGKHVVAELRFLPRRITVAVSADANTSPRRLRVLELASQDLREFWPSVRVVKPLPGRRDLFDELSLEPGHVPKAEIFRWIDDRMDKLRWLFSPNRERVGDWTPDACTVRLDAKQTSVEL